MLRKFIKNNPRLKNFMLWFGVNNYENTTSQFTPYFHYTIGKAQEQYELYFHKQPSARQYYANIFLRLSAYNPHEAIKYLEYHYELYPDKKDFLLFVQRDLQFRITNAGTNERIPSWLIISQLSLKWAQEKLNEWEGENDIQAFEEFLRRELTEILRHEFKFTSPTRDPIPTDQLADKIWGLLKEKMEADPADTENEIKRMAGQLETGDIHLANAHHKEKLISLFLCLKDLTGKPKRAQKQGEPLFTKMNINDIAMILRLHFAPFKTLKVDSIEKQIYKVNNNNNQHSDDPKLQELSRALQRFFF